ncbi:helix-turn-helix domain-containing protein [Desulfacinum hydrothermale]|uniref:helix-turn-helix domain-containing protein n=1 Tax=Desulfacinum hydrothermale TaxID=109258 RepID=UPI0009FFED71|nr:helix-turn-helix domain-containing protein [Desulfacinum hydrothermale]
MKNRRRIEIKKWLLDAGMTQAKIAKETGASPAIVSRVISGERGRRRKGLSAAVIDYLERRGCPIFSEESNA